MTDETKKMFDAPWEVCLEKRGSFYRPCVVSSDTKIASVCTKENANRLARLPELYDALLNMAQEKCNEHTYRGENACDDCAVKEYCDVFEIYELLKKVRDGE